MSQLDTRFIEQAKIALHHLLLTHPELAEDDVLRLDMVEGNTNALELIDELIRAEREAYAMMQGLAEESARMDKRLMRFSGRRAAIRKYIFQIMEAANLRKAERPAATVSIAAGRSKVIITGEEALPAQYVRILRQPNKEAIVEDLKAGKTIPGATLSNAEPVLRIS